ncbi:MAG: hypothetical protein JNM88_19260 [Chitinophagaceae bacterium]|nr:hypothetical protein [Chitinophagaceae bacterium]
MAKKIFTVVLLCFFSNAFSQDYLISWKGDTLFCELPDNPRKEGFRPVGNFTNGYKKIAVFTGADSVRVVEAGQIKGYRRHKHGKNLLCDGYFESVRVPDGNGEYTTPEGKNEGEWHFMLLEHKGRHASLYKMLVWGRRLYTYYYVVKHGGEAAVPEGYKIFNRSRAEKLLADEDIKTEMQQVIKREKKFTRMVEEYNRLKEAAAAKQIPVTPGIP